VDKIGLDAIVVSASKRKERILDAPASVTLINTVQNFQKALYLQVLFIT